MTEGVFRIMCVTVDGLIQHRLDKDVPRKEGARLALLLAVFDLEHFFRRDNHGCNFVTETGLGDFVLDVRLYLVLMTRICPDYIPFLVHQIAFPYRI